MQAAQMAKLDAVIAAADIQPTDHVLEIGCGWGSFAMRAASTTGCRWAMCSAYLKLLEQHTPIQRQLCARLHVSLVGAGDLRLAHLPGTNMAAPLRLNSCHCLLAVLRPARVTGLTLSKAQLAEATARVAAAGLSDKVTLLFCDYRWACCLCVPIHLQCHGP